jgi:hypothetical protein
VKNNSRILISPRILRHKIHTPIRILRRTSRIIRPHIPGPIPTKRGIKHKRQIREMSLDITTCEVGLGCAPGGGVLEVGGDGVPREEPDGDGGGRDLGGVDAAADAVEAGAVGAAGGGGDAAAGVAVYGGVAVGGLLGAELVGAGVDDAAW